MDTVVRKKKGNLTKACTVVINITVEKELKKMISKILRHEDAKNIIQLKYNLTFTRSDFE